ncbi:hypothetical protein N9H09_00590 [bacterium]|nr:hypothetical protein [bacterium]MDB4666678.1 hypothetical protein [bacterium]MDB4731164.1 hypothetical protein [Akkermansiaceae bacterium]
MKTHDPRQYFHPGVIHSGATAFAATIFSASPVSFSFETPEKIRDIYKANIAVESDIIVDFFKAMIEAGYKWPVHIACTTSKA